MNNCALREQKLTFPPLYVFIHCYQVNNWKSILQNQLNLISSSGLREAVTELFVCSEKNIDKLSGTYSSIIIDSDTRIGELPTLAYLQKYMSGMSADSNVLYLHSKGVTRTNNPTISDWRDMMEYFLLDKQWKLSLSLLDHFDTVGVNWHKQPRPHYSGNFWYARASYIHKLPSVISLPNSYYESEFWLGSGAGRHFCLHESGIDHYVEPYPRNYYNLALWPSKFDVTITK